MNNKAIFFLLIMPYVLLAPSHADNDRDATDKRKYASTAALSRAIRQNASRGQAAPQNNLIWELRTVYNVSDRESQMFAGAIRAELDKEGKTLDLLHVDERAQFICNYLSQFGYVMPDKTN